MPLGDTFTVSLSLSLSLSLCVCVCVLFLYTGVYLRIAGSKTELHKIKTSLESRLPYKFFISASKNNKQKAYPFAVLTALHNEVFKGATSIRGGRSGRGETSPQPCRAGCILALLADLKEGGSIYIINVYQRTAGSLLRKGLLWAELKTIVGLSSDNPLLLLGDLNGAPTCKWPKTEISWTDLGTKKNPDHSELRIPGLEQLLQASPVIDIDSYH